jgi:hypothetical protein
MRPITKSVTGVGVSAPIPLDQYISPFNVGFGVVVSGTVTYTVQHTFDNVWAAGYTPASGNWFNHPDVASETANADGNYAFPVTAIRLSVASGSGTATITAVQAGIAS